jgi:Na+-driven multidrug efflux pump
VERSKKLGTENPGKLLLQFSIPAIVGLLVQAFYNVIARVFIGNTVGYILVKMNPKVAIAVAAMRA